MRPRGLLLLPLLAAPQRPAQGESSGAALAPAGFFLDPWQEEPDLTASLERRQGFDLIFAGSEDVLGRTVAQVCVSPPLPPTA